jgi:hypothetical protein
MMRSNYILILLFSVAILFMGCKETPKSNLALLTTPLEVDSETVNTRDLSQEFKDYWYAGKAEITSYELKQARYGELREGTAMTIFVTEDFLPEVQVKANNPSKDNIPVLKLNSTKNFLTGVYPYSIMTSTFSPVNSKEHALKVSNSVQEWCGHVYAQLNNRKEFEITAHSYFEGEADQKMKLPKTWLENELWNLIRINPKELPTGKAEIIPSFDYLRLGHKDLKAYRAILSLEQNESMQVYTIQYPDIERSLTIYFENKFPFSIEKWEETYVGGFGQGAKTLTTTATKMKQIKTAYWSQNKNSDIVLRDELGLD